MIKSLIFILLLSGSSILFGQEIKIYNEFLEPIIMVEVISMQSGKKVFTNEKGFAQAKGFEENDTLFIAREGYIPVTLPLKTIRLLLNYQVLLHYETIFLEGVEATVTVRARKFNKARRPIKLDVVTKENIFKVGSQTASDILEETGNIQIQKSQSGGGSPIIRGMEANKVLLVIDGVRMNNAIYRGGHLQNSITLDNNILEQVDISYGPGSVSYGSDALGGVIHYYTKNPLNNSDSLFHFNGAFSSSYSSANQGLTTHLDFSLSKQKWGSLTSISYKQFGKVTMGKNRTHGYNDWGIVNHNQGFENGQDTMLLNLDTNTQQHTDYNQTDLLQKIVYRPNNKISFTFNGQYSSSSKINRYDQLTKYKNGKLKYAEWYYGPQKRLLTALTTEIKDENSFFDNASIILSYQDIEESRITRKFNNLDRISRIEKVKLGALNLDFSKHLKNKTKLFYGGETTHNNVKSKSLSTNIQNQEEQINSTRYPDNGSKMSTGAIYVNLTQSYEKLLWKFGNRLTFTSLEANFKDTNFIHLPFDKIKANSQAFSSSFGLVISPTNSFRINTNLSSGFRTPNIDDFGKVFEIDDYVVIPNNNIKPEYAYTGELGFSKTFRRNYIEKDSSYTRLHFATISATGYYTLLDNLIVKSDFRLNENDSIVYEGEMKKVQANINLDNGFIYGISGGLKLSFNRYIKLKSTLNYTVGRVTSTNQPLAHIQPLFGRTSLIFDLPKWNLEFYGVYNGQKKIIDFAPGGTDNSDEATVDGIPKWYTLNIRGGYQFNSKISVQAGIQNLMDVHYKTFSSGISAVGRSFNISTRILF